MPQVLLHGILRVTIFEGDLLGNPPLPADVVAPRFVRKRRRLLKRFSWIKRMSFCQPKVVQEIEEAVGLGRESAKLYATVDLEKTRVARTRVISSEPMSPRWYESFHIYCAHEVTHVIFTVKADDHIGASLIGRAYLPVEEIIDGEEVDQWLAICDEDRKPLKQGARIHVMLQYLAASKDPQQNWGTGIASSRYAGVPRTFFQQRSGCKLTLYQDAHVARNQQRTLRFPLEGNQYYEPSRCWEDIFDAISNACHLVYITGWSVFPEITLVRERDPRKANERTEITLGKLLKSKAQEGVRVLMLVWDDRTSMGLGPLKRDGVMATHDQDTLSYFSDSDVHCVLCPRNPDDAESFVQGLEISTMFTHHQKSLVVDGDQVVLGRGTRRTTRSLLSFVGGIDLCDGRYDTQQHSLFQTLGTTHRNDFHQPNFPGASIKKGGPREPWHDIHCRLQGPVAWDVLHNFEQRWRKQGGGEELLLPQEYLAAAIDADRHASSSRDDMTEAWNIQLFRSIDGGAVDGFPKTSQDAALVGLVSGKNHVIERSIQDAYILAIRRAKSFIYIENQYFVGSSFGWREIDGIKAEDVGALNLIPKELSLKIISKIEAGERFTVYVVIPMWPEGVPESASVQAILDWQRRTIQMMYADIAETIRAKGLHAKPQDYLIFFCLGNREERRMNEYIPEERPELDTDYYRAQQARRFMIYVHAKMMIVDDEYIIVGSANINQRSMDGGRDSEIAIGAYQPSHLATDNKSARGQIHGFRLSLWYEHLGMQDNAFLSPQSLECVRKMIQVAERNWNLYASDEKLYNDLPSHLLKYPITINDDGNITEMPGMEVFPDTKARILGTKSELLPAILTT